MELVDTIVVMVLIGLGLLMYFQSRRRSTRKAATPEQLAREATVPRIDVDPSLETGEQTTQFYSQLKKLTPHVFVTPTLLLINLAVFAAMIADGVDVMSPSIEHLLNWGANHAPTTTGGEWWRLLTSTFVHVGIIHIAFNMWVLWDAGRLVERLLGNVGFITMYVVSGLCGSYTSILWNPLVVSAGASGAVFGVFGCLLGYLLLSRGSIPTAVLKHIGTNALVFIGYNVYFAIGQEGIDMAAHAGGLGAGFLCGVTMRWSLAWRAAGMRWVGNVVVAGLGSLAIGFAISNGLGHVADVQAAILRFAEVEQRVITKFNDSIDQVVAGELSDSEHILFLDQQILTPWRKARVSFATLHDIPSEQKQLFDQLLNYMNTREDAWRLAIELSKSGDEDTLERFNEKMEQAEQIIAEMNEPE